MRTPLVLAAALLFASGVSAQRQFDELAKRYLPIDTDNTKAVALGDVDGDGDLDLVFGNWRTRNVTTGQDRLYLNDGKGRFTDATAARMPVDIRSTTAVALGDVDGDGDLDLVLGTWDFGTLQRANRLYLNDGDGRYVNVTATHMPLGLGANSALTYAVALGDVDGDGDLDVVFGDDGQNQLFLNDGTGTFADATAARLPTDDDLTAAVALGDVDGDGDLDLVFGNGGSWGDVQNRLCLNDGTGAFTDVTAARMSTARGYTGAVALGDVDGDGDPDLIFGDGGQNHLYLNDGTGTFTDATAGRMPFDADYSAGLALGDVDGDGDPDLVLGNYFYQQNRLYLNDGTGTFTDVTAARMPTDNDLTTGVALGDVDGDGDNDVVFSTSEFAPNRRYLNLLRQLDAPFVATPGQAYRLDAYARYGPVRNQDVAQPWLSTGTANIQLPPLGTFGLDPTQMVALPRLVMPQPAGMASLSFIIPNVPSLSGVAFYAQALLVHDPVTVPAVLTNVTADVVQ